MTDQPTDRAELLADVHRRIHASLGEFVTSLQPAISVDDALRVLLGASTTLLAEHVGRSRASLTLQSLAASLEQGGTAPEHLN